MKMKWYRNPVYVSKTPLIAVFLLEIANVQQLWRMWAEQTAAGQSIGGWLCVQLALWLWLNFYATFTPDQKFAIRGTQLGILMNASVIGTVLWFRWIA
jgi:uncharacterized protein with PQ loop repeat